MYSSLKIRDRYWVTITKWKKFINYSYLLCWITPHWDDYCLPCSGHLTSQPPGLLYRGSCVTPFLSNRWRSTDYWDPNNAAHYVARAARPAAQTNARAHSRMRLCFSVSAQTYTKSAICIASCSIVHFLKPHVNWP